MLGQAMLDHFVAMRRDATTAVPVPGRAHVPCAFRFRSDGEAVGTLYLEFDAAVPGRWVRIGCRRKFFLL